MSKNGVGLLPHCRFVSWRVTDAFQGTKINSFFRLRNSSDEFADVFRRIRGWKDEFTDVFRRIHGWKDEFADVSRRIHGCFQTNSRMKRQFHGKKRRNYGCLPGLFRSSHVIPTRICAVAGIYGCVCMWAYTQGLTSPAYWLSPLRGWADTQNRNRRVSLRRLSGMEMILSIFGKPYRESAGSLLAMVCSA